MSHPTKCHNGYNREKKRFDSLKTVPARFYHRYKTDPKTAFVFINSYDKQSLKSFPNILSDQRVFLDFLAGYR